MVENHRKKSHSKLRGKRATFTFLSGRLRSNSVIRPVTFNRTKIGVKKIQLRHYERFSNNVFPCYKFNELLISNSVWVQTIWGQMKMDSVFSRYIYLFIQGYEKDIAKGNPHIALHFVNLFRSYYEFVELNSKRHNIIFSGRFRLVRGKEGEKC